MEVLQSLKTEVLNCLTTNILPFWLDNMQDNERGGFYGSSAYLCSVSYRLDCNPSYSYLSIGFRVVRSSSN